MTRTRRFPVVAPLAAGIAILAVLWSAVAFADRVPASFAELARKLLPAVVSITSTRSVERDTAPDESPPLDDFYDDFLDDKLPSRQLDALGSGFIIDPNGYVVTNHHVVAEGKDIKINLADGRTMDARVVGIDEPTDLALLKIEVGGSLPYVLWGSSDSVEIGDWVVAIGNSFGLGGTLTAGVLSGRARDIQAGPYDDFLQTDAAINTGNSGGPLFDMNGRVIGVNTAILSPTGGNIGIGFAIPASTAKPIVDQLRRSGTVRRGWLGVRIQSVTEQLAAALGLDTVRGALVAEVIASSPAKQAGIRPGDVILSFGGKAVERARDLPRLVANAEIGRQVAIELWRDGGKRSLTATVMLRKGAEASRPVPAAGEQETVVLGMALAPLDDETRQRLELDGKASGVVVTGVHPDGPAASQGIQPGDVIVEVSREPVTEPAQVVEKIEKVKREGGRAALLRINRDGSYQFAAIPV